MGVAVSGWRLARTVAAEGQLGVVSGVALDVVMVRRLQDGDPGGHVRRALARFPVPGVAEQIVDRWYRPEGRPPGTPYRTVPKLTAAPDPAHQDLVVAAAFVEVFLAKEGHEGTVGLNLLEKIRLATPATLYGALLAGVDVVLVGAGIPDRIPGLLDRLTRHETVALPLDVEGAEAGEETNVELEPRRVLAGTVLPDLRRPVFLAIVSSVVLATYLARDPSRRPDGFVVEGASAGGHNAPPRGRQQLDDSGQPIYGPRDVVDPGAMAALGLPFWLAGSYGREGRLEDARAAGAAGIQVGTAFAYSRESGLDDALRLRVLDEVREGASVRTDPLASPTGYPFKVVDVEGTAGVPDVAAARRRVCDLGYLRVAYRKADGSVGYRCPAEPVDAYVRKGGRVEDTVGRLCLCNGLLAAVGLGQVRAGGRAEPPLVTAGEDLARIARDVPDAPPSAADVLRGLTVPTARSHRPR
ncbi:MAG: nitronate monooxygenase [Acidimicrobiia bacterium]|nr:nitronate monooxygenase [Acidimicrobiia bacterium]